MSSLPPGFETLEPFVAQWALPTAAQRAAKRGASTEAERQAFYQAAFAALPAALAHLDQKPLAAFNDKEQTLMRLMLSLAHVSLAVEAQGPAEAVHAKARQHMRITRAMSDL